MNYFMLNKKYRQGSSGKGSRMETTLRTTSADKTSGNQPTVLCFDFFDLDMQSKRKYRLNVTLYGATSRYVLRNFEGNWYVWNVCSVTNNLYYIGVFETDNCAIKHTLGLL